MVVLDVILPVFFIIGAGFALGRWPRLDVRLLTNVVFFVLSPALIFRTVYAVEFTGGDLFRTVIFVFAVQGGLFLLSRGIGRALGWDDDVRAVGSLTLSFSNCGNYGLPVLLFAFGEAGFALGLIYVVASLVMQATLGVGVAAWRRGMSVSYFLRRLARVPWGYAFLLGLLLRAAGIGLPTGLFGAVDLLAEAAIPLQLVLLGVQLSRIRLGTIARESVVMTGLKLIVPPLLAWGLAEALGATGMLRAVLILEASMPSAVNSMILATHYDRRPGLASAVVFLTTALSLGSLTALLMILR